MNYNDEKNSSPVSKSKAMHNTGAGGSRRGDYTSDFPFLN